VTGNGSITNFPFVPTVKIVTTTRRYELLSHEMDVNAGAYLDGMPMDELGRRMLDLTLEIASGARSVGEQAGHAQVQLWRNWRQQDTNGLSRLLVGPAPTGQPLPIKAAEPPPDLQFQAICTDRGPATTQVGLILPTSLCAGQVAQIAAARLNSRELGQDQKLSRFVSLVHTEGCGVSSGPSEALYLRTLISYLTHPLVRHGLLLEHGCEKTHNRYVRHQLEQMGLDPDRFGWASIQWDGGIERVLDKIESWFATELGRSEPLRYEPAGLDHLRLGLLVAGPISPAASQGLARLTRMIVGAGGTLVAPHQAGLLSTTYIEETSGSLPELPSLAYAQRLPGSGFHLMDTPTEDWAEVLTGLGATGVEIILVYAGQHPVQAHPLVPVLQVTAEKSVAGTYVDDLDLVLAGDPSGWPAQLLGRVIDTLTHQYVPRLFRQGNVEFQVTRGLLGVSL
jgi:altronate dehydratase